MACNFFMLLSRMETLQMHSRRGLTQIATCGQSSQRVREIPSMKLPEPKLRKVIAHCSKFNNNTNKPNNLCKCFHLKPLRDRAGSFNLILSDAFEDLCLDLWIGSFRHWLVFFLSLPFVTKKVANKFHHKQRTPNEEIEETFFFGGGGERNHKNCALQELDFWRF